MTILGARVANLTLGDLGSRAMDKSDRSNGPDSTRKTRSVKGKIKDSSQNDARRQVDEDYPEIQRVQDKIDDVQSGLDDLNRSSATSKRSSVLYDSDAMARIRAQRDGE
jgi:hypothetical protein